MWSIQTIETELTEGEHIFVIPRREGEDQAVVLVEQLGGEPGELSVEASNIPGTQLSSHGKAQVFMGNFVDDAQDITLRVYLQATRWVRITIATIRSGVANAFGKLPCRLCKKLVKMLLMTALALLGVPYMDKDVFFDDDLLKALNDLLSDTTYSALESLVKEINLGIWDAILKTVAGVEFIFELADKLYEKVCQSIGLCPKAA